MQRSTIQLHRDRPARSGARAPGARLPTLAVTLLAEDTPWRTVVVPGWYGSTQRGIEVASGTAVWRHGGMPVVPIRWVLVRDPTRRFEPQALLCTGLACEPAQIVSWFVRRWSVEVTFKEIRAHLGVETQRKWHTPIVAATVVKASPLRASRTNRSGPECVKRAC